jgi:hypothetical protein
MSTTNQPSLRDLLDLARQLELDREASPSGLRHRDREIGRDLGVPPERPVGQLLRWLGSIRATSAELAGDRINTLHRLGLFLLAVAGALAGWGAAAVVFRYDGTHPVNVIHVVVVFVFLQLLTLFFFALGLLPSAVARWIPGWRTLQEFLGLISPGRIQRLLDRRLPQAYRDRAGALLGRGIAHQKLYGPVERWVTVHSSQAFAVFFNLGALASALYLVAFSDLAFSWSTTLEVEPARMKAWTDALSVPWAAFFADARPSLELIESTRYFRLQEGSFPAAVSPVGLGGWWPFLIMGMAVYGLLPRLVTWLVTRQRMRGALRSSFRSLPGTDEVLARLNSELVETEVQGRDPGLADLEGDVAATEGDSELSGAAVAVIDWSEAVPDEATGREWLSRDAGVSVATWQAAGGALPPERDRRTIEDVAAPDGPGRIVVLVKAWEPPVGDLFDFLRELRAHLERDRMVMVAPLGRTEAGSVWAADPEALRTWRQSVARSGDPWMRVVELGGRR